jgi:hypothetical protein
MAGEKNDLMLTLWVLYSSYLLLDIVSTKLSIWSLANCAESPHILHHQSEIISGRIPVADVPGAFCDLVDTRIVKQCSLYHPREVAWGEHERVSAVNRESFVGWQVGKDDWQSEECGLVRCEAKGLVPRRQHDKAHAIVEGKLA